MSEPDRKEYDPMMVARFTVRSYRAQVALALGAVGAYGLMFFPIYHLMGPPAVSLATLPVAVAGWRLGMRAGLLFGLFCFPLNILLLSLVGQPGWHELTGTGGGVLGSILLVLIGSVVGRISDLGQQAARELTERKRAEEALQLERGQLLSIFESIDEIIYVADQNTYEILYVNQALRDAFQKDLVGGLCYREFQGSDSPCEFCTNEIILKEKYKPYRWEYHNPILVRDYAITDRIIKWPDGRDVRFELAMDITERKRAERAQEVVYKISLAAVSTERPEDLFHSIHSILGELMPVENFYIALYDSASDLLSFPYFVDQYDEPSPPKKLGHGLTEYVLRTGRPLLAPQEVFDRLVHQGEVELVGTNSIDWLGVPLKVEERVIGVMVTQSYTEGIRFTQKDADLLGFISTQVALAIERKRTEEQMQQNAARLADILKLSMELAALREGSAVLNTLVTCAAVIMESATCTVMMIDTAANEAVLTAQTGLPESTPSDLRVPLTLPVIRQMLETGEPIIQSDIDREAPAMRAVLVRPDIHAFFAYPMVRAGRVIGVITFSKLTPYTPSAAEAAACRLLAERAAVALENARLFEETTRNLKRVQALHTIETTITSSFDLHLTLNILVEQTMTQLGVDAVDVLVFNPHTQMLDYAAGSGFRTTALQGTHLRLGQGYAGMAGLEQKTIHVSDLRGHTTDFLRSPNFSMEEFDTYFGVPLTAKGQIKGVLEVFHRSPFQPDQVWLEFLETLAKQAAIAIDNASLFNDLQRSNVELTMAYDATIEGWSFALDLRDKETEGHTQRVTEMTVRLAREMGMSDAELAHVRCGALLHDIGKMGVPDSILHKPGPLTDEEWVIMRKHPQYAFEMLSPINYLRLALDIPYCHHEKWDGSGYPRGLKGEQIPLAARIFAVVDVWDALGSDRPYRKAWPQEKIIDYIREQSGKHFDPQLVERFLPVLKNFTE